MHFIFGGRYMGKLAYAKGLMADPSVCDLASGSADELFDTDIVCNIQLLVKRMVLDGTDPAGFFMANMDRLQNKIMIGDEVGCGVVPIEATDRDWRDETGRVYQLLAKHARQVTRVWCGIPQALKQDGAPV